MIVLGLTGSIGMGKTTTAAMLRARGLPVQDADAVVADLYAHGGAAVGAVAALYPDVVADGAVDRKRLAARVLGDAPALTALEAAVHPLVQAARQVFLDQARANEAPIAVLDVPLLFEAGADAMTDAVVVVSAPLALQRARVLARPGMTVRRFEQILARQLPDADKRRRADFIIDTSQGLAATQEQLDAMLAAVQAPGFRSRRLRQA